MKQMPICILLFLSLLAYKCGGGKRDETLDYENDNRDSIDLYINLEHLEYLNEEISIDGISMMITHIYCEFPDYGWVDASGEGIACVDDVSRAAIVFLRYFEITGDNTYLDKAKGCLNFVMYMEEDDGQFYNFIRDDRSVNTEGRTSKKSFDFWAARGLRALCYGYRVLKPLDEDYAEKLREHIEPTFQQIEEFLKNYNEYEFVEGTRVPKWLIIGGDITSEVVLALLDYYLVIPDGQVKAIIEKLVHGLMEFQIQEPTCPFYGVHLSWKNIWHLWGNTQTEALAKAGRVFDKSSWIESAKLEADNFYIYLLSMNFLQSIVLKKDRHEICEFPQISYGIRAMVSGLTQLYLTTNDDKYAKLAGITASWLRGNNRASCPMYDPKTGRVYDGINSAEKVNLNSGAESTIEGIMTLLEITENPTSKEYYYSDLEFTAEDERSVLYRIPKGEEIKIGWDEKTERWTIYEQH